MGWAKYYEDNVSIYNDRIFMREPVINAVRVAKAPEVKIHKQIIFVASAPLAEYRSGIMLSFDKDIERAVSRKLQMNGWWFSKTNNCWCNYNNLVNRQYAQRLAINHKARIVFAA